jgi:hypothetical protein
LDFPADWCANTIRVTSVSLTRDEAVNLMKDLGKILGETKRG